MKNSVKKFSSKFSFLLFVYTLSLVGCGEYDKASYEVRRLNDSLENKSTSTGNKSLGSFKKALNRQFIRTADLKFKVANVIATTRNIELAVRRHGGFVISTELNSQVLDVHTVGISADSSLETTHYKVLNDMILRIPNTALDSTLYEISESATHIDFRNIKAEDVALQLLSNNLAQNRLTRNANRVENNIDNKGKKLTESTMAEELLIQRQEQADAAGIANLSLNDQVSFSTIKLSFYERPSVRREHIVNNKVVEEYEPSFVEKLSKSLFEGWKVLEAILVFLVKIWGFILLLSIVYLIYLWKGFRLSRRHE